MFALAERLGRTVGELAESMTVSEFHHWMAWAIRRQQERA